jgi:hypothetical protein
MSAMADSCPLSAMECTVTVRRTGCAVASHEALYAGVHGSFGPVGVYRGKHPQALRGRQVVRIKTSTS